MNSVRCPHCGFEQQPHVDGTLFEYAELKPTDENVCNSCGRSFTIMVRMVLTCEVINTEDLHDE